MEHEYVTIEEAIEIVIELAKKHDQLTSHQLEAIRVVEDFAINQLGEQ